MAQVTYRGVKYDSKEYNAKVLAEAAQKQRHDLMYRGLKVTKKVAEVCNVDHRRNLTASVVFLGIIYLERNSCTIINNCYRRLRQCYA